jgi:hypothetical protein
MPGPRPHGLRRLHRLQQLGHIADPVLELTDDWTGNAPGRHHHGSHPRRRGPSVLRLLLAGLAVIAFAKVMSAASGRRRSTAERVLLGGLVLLLGAVVLSFRRSSPRYR